MQNRGMTLIDKHGNHAPQYYKLIAILRRQYGIILTASWKKIYSVLGGVAKRLKVAISFVSQFNCFSGEKEAKLNITFAD